MAAACRGPEAPAPGRTDRRRSGPSSRSCCPAATSTSPGPSTATGVMRLATARDEILPAARSAGPGERGVPDGHPALPGRSPGSGRLRAGQPGRHRGDVRLRPGLPPGPLPAGQPGGHVAGGGRPARPATTSSRSRSAGGTPGGIVTYATDRLFEEVAYVAYHFHWSIDEILDLEHPIRRRFVEEIGAHQPAPDRRGVELVVRWSFNWPFREGPRGASAGPGSTGSPGDEAAADADARPADGPRTSGSWRELPPLEPTVEAAPLTAATGAFASGLAGGRSARADPPPARPRPHRRRPGRAHRRPHDAHGRDRRGDRGRPGLPEASPAERTLRRAGRSRPAASVAREAGVAAASDEVGSRRRSHAAWGCGGRALTGERAPGRARAAPAVDGGPAGDGRPRPSRRGRQPSPRLTPPLPSLLPLPAPTPRARGRSVMARRRSTTRRPAPSRPCRRCVAASSGARWQPACPLDGSVSGCRSRALCLSSANRPTVPCRRGRPRCPPSGRSPRGRHPCAAGLNCRSRCWGPQRPAPRYSGRRPRRRSRRPERRQARPGRVWRTPTTRRRPPRDPPRNCSRQRPTARPNQSRRGPRPPPTGSPMRSPPLVGPPRRAALHRHSQPRRPQRHRPAQRPAAALHAAPPRPKRPSRRPPGRRSSASPPPQGPPPGPGLPPAPS